MATKLQWQPMATKFQLQPSTQWQQKVQIEQKVTNWFLVVLASYVIWACFMFDVNQVLSLQTYTKLPDEFSP